MPLRVYRKRTNEFHLYLAKQSTFPCPWNSTHLPLFYLLLSAKFQAVCWVYQMNKTVAAFSEPRII